MKKDEAIVLGVAIGIVALAFLWEPISAVHWWSFGKGLR